MSSLLLRWIEERGLDFFESLGREDGCLALARAFYGRVARDAVLRPLFPGKSLRCASEELSAFLVFLFDGDESRAQYRWWLSLRESHARFKISEGQRAVWVGLMSETVEEAVSAPEARAGLRDFFLKASLYIVGQESDSILPAELDWVWNRQLCLDRIVDELQNGRDEGAMELADSQAARRGVFVGILARMMETRREPLVHYALVSLERDPGLMEGRFNGRTLLHYAASTSPRVVRALLDGGVDPNVLDAGGHTPLYRAEAGVVRALIKAGAAVDHSGGVSRATALHEAARHGRLEVVRELLAHGANPKVRDKKGTTPLDRALNRRHHDVAALLR